MLAGNRWKIRVRAGFEISSTLVTDWELESWVSGFGSAMEKWV
jgi:hypothetical protein